MALFDEIEQATGGGDEDIDAGTHRGDLRVLADAAVDERLAETDFLAVGGETLSDLDREFPRGCEHKAAALLGAGVARIHVDCVEDGKREACRFSGACLCAAEKIPTFEKERDGLGLDGGRGNVFEFVENLF